MDLKGFIKTISFASLAGILLMVVIGLAVPIYKYFYMSLSCFIMFIILSVIVYFLAERALNNPKKRGLPFGCCDQYLYETICLLRLCVCLCQNTGSTRQIVPYTIPGFLSGICCSRNTFFDHASQKQ